MLPRWTPEGMAQGHLFAVSLRFRHPFQPLPLSLPFSSPLQPQQALMKRVSWRTSRIEVGISRSCKVFIAKVCGFTMMFGCCCGADSATNTQLCGALTVSPIKLRSASPFQMRKGLLRSLDSTFSFRRSRPPSTNSTPVIFFVQKWHAPKTLILATY
jgi:hypothetical protein